MTSTTRIMPNNRICRFCAAWDHINCSKNEKRDKDGNRLYPMWGNCLKGHGFDIPWGKEACEDFELSRLFAHLAQPGG